MTSRSNYVVAGAMIAASLILSHALVGQSEWRQLANPAAAGWDEAELSSARGVATRAGSAAVMAVLDGRVIVAWGDVERRFKCHSVRKSILSALIGIAVERGDIDLQQTLAELGIDDQEALTAIEKSARIEHLLAARSGIYHPAAKEPVGMKRNRPARHSQKPGGAFFYNNWDFNVLGVIFAQRTGKSVTRAFEEWLAGPLGLQDYRPGDGTFELEPGNSRHPAYAFRLSARDLARFGMLYADAGVCGDRRVVSPEWIERSTAVVSKLDGGRGYGLMWWVYPRGSLPRLGALDEYDVIAASGTGGQICIVVPALRFVLVHRGDTDNGRRVGGGVVWKIANQILAARPGERGGPVETMPLLAEPFPGTLPPPLPRLPIEVAPEALAEFAGEYEVEPLGRCRVFLHEGRAFVRNPMGQESELRCEATDRYFLVTENMTCRALRDDGGRIDGIELDMHGRKLRGRRVRAR